LCRAGNVRFEAAVYKGLHPGQTANVFANGQCIGLLGGLHPELRKTAGISGQAYVFELSLEKLTQGNVPNFKSLSKFPQVRRDIALLVDENLPLQSLQDVIIENAGEQFLKSWVFDVYQGEGVATDKKSVAIAMSFQHQNRSLNDEEVQQTVDSIIQVLEKQLAAVLR
jgi:phenylalanyl-tRNA synthetase beta chain